MPVHTSSHANGAGHVPYADFTADRAQSQWLFTPTELLKSPSILEGLSVEQELANRQKGVSFIKQVGIMLKLPQLTLAAASVFLHRFYMRYPMQVSKDKGIHHYQVAATSLFLATKVEENCRKMKELIVACCRVAQKDPNSFIDEQSKEYWKWRDTILYHEDLLLEALCFDLQLEQSYRILLYYLCYYGVQEQKNLRNTSWAFLNDSHITTMCLMHLPKTIAGAALYAGIKLVGTTLPDDEQGRPWWEHLDLDIQEVQQACNQMADVYENPNLPREGQKDVYVKDEDAFSFERTRRTQSPSFGVSPSHSIRSTSQGVKREREDSWGHEKKNGHSVEPTSLEKVDFGQNGLSPKRQRKDSGPLEAGSRIPADVASTHTQRTSSGAGSMVLSTVNGSKDEVQQRIDDIVNGSTSNNRSHISTEKSQETHDRYSQQKGTPDFLAARQDRSKMELTSGGANGSSDITQQPSYSRGVGDGDVTEEVDYGSEEGEV